MDDPTDSQAVGLTKARYRDWVKRDARDALLDRRPVAPHRDGILLVERDAVRAYALTHPKDGYRRLTWQMIDEDVAYLSPSSVYRILDEADLLYRWKRSESPRDCRRLHSVRGWSHATNITVFPRGAGALGASGARAHERARVTVGRDHVDCWQVGLHA